MHDLLSLIKELDCWIEGANLGCIFKNCEALNHNIMHRHLFNLLIPWFLSYMLHCYI